jgi:putative transposase
MAILRWSRVTLVEWHYIAPGPFDKLRVRADAKRLCGKLQRPSKGRAAERDIVHLARPCSYCFGCLEDDYNTVRPHSALGNLAPAIYAKLSEPAKQRDGTLRAIGGSAPHPVAPPSRTGSNKQQTLFIPG